MGWNFGLVIGILKALGFLDDGGRPQERYFEFLDQSQSGIVLAEAIREAYGDLFAINTTAHEMTKEDLAGKFRNLGQGKLSANVINFMASTFLALAEQADFDMTRVRPDDVEGGDKPPANPPEAKDPSRRTHDLKLGDLVYNIQIVLPDTRDPAVFDALFRSLKEHLQ